LVVSDAHTGYISLFDTNSFKIKSYFGGNGPTFHNLNMPYCAIFDGSNFIIVSTFQQRIIFGDKNFKFTKVISTESDWGYVKKEKINTQIYGPPGWNNQYIKIGGQEINLAEKIYLLGYGWLYHKDKLSLGFQLPSAPSIFNGYAYFTDAATFDNGYFIISPQSSQAFFLEKDKNYLFAFTIPTLVTNARLQIVIDRSNAEMLAFIVKNAPQRSTIWINIQEPNEYVTEFILWVNQVSDRPDLQVDYFHGQDLITAEAKGQEIWIVSPNIENQFYPSVRMGVYENNSKTWNQILEIYLNGKGEQIDGIHYSFQILIFDPIRFFCPLMDLPSYCQVSINPLDDRIFSYGWTIDRLP
ncbi:MAG: hypothetical protein NTZ12_07105, partial [Candidatus Aminicenantes bacterium]|nr:hypothetical protein [Candidatus Aminicenantes bacterium]